MISYCIGCFEINKEPQSQFLCTFCYNSLIPATPPPLGSSLFAYVFLTRQLILRTKVAGDHRALATLIQLFTESPITSLMVDQCDLIVAAPSSFWGRLRGRVDIAAHLAAALAGKHGIPLGRAPWHCYWRMTKRAIQTQKSQNIVDFTSALEGQQILIVDDVITTGYTISKVAQEFHHQSLDFLTLANASQS